MSAQYARQTYALGAYGAQRLSHAAVLVIGMRGVGAETGAGAQRAAALAAALSSAARSQELGAVRRAHAGGARRGADGGGGLVRAGACGCGCAHASGES